MFLYINGNWTKVTADFDLALTEVLGKDEHYFVVEVGSQLGLELMQQ